MARAEPHAGAGGAEPARAGRAGGDRRRSGSRGSRRWTGARRGTRSRSSPALHALAAELALPRLTAADVEAMRDGQRALRRRRCSDVDVDAALAADDAFHAVFSTASANVEIGRALDRLMPRLRRLERLRFGSLARPRVRRASTTTIIAAAAHDGQTTAERVRENWLSLGTLIDRSFE